MKACFFLSVMQVHLETPHPSGQHLQEYISVTIVPVQYQSTDLTRTFGDPQSMVPLAEVVHRFSGKLGEGNLGMLVCQNLHHQVAVEALPHLLSALRQSTLLPESNPRMRRNGPVVLPKYARPMVRVLPMMLGPNHGKPPSPFIPAKSLTICQPQTYQWIGLPSKSNV